MMNGPPYEHSCMDSSSQKKARHVTSFLLRNHVFHCTGVFRNVMINFMQEVSGA